ncbi:MAG: hypothetical protein PHR89_05115 [Bacilli bacterium]|nr:hypothetical protein [Bacilli bacterium]
MEDFDLFEDNSPVLKLCDGCKRYFDVADLKQCRVCGQYYCPECRKTHDCRYTRKVSPKQQSNQAPPVGTPPYSIPRTPKTYSMGNPIDQSIPPLEPESAQVMCQGCGRYFPKSEMRSCHTCKQVLCPDCRTHHKCPQKVRNLRQPKSRPVQGSGYHEPNLAHERPRRPTDNKKLIICGTFIGVIIIAIIILSVVMSGGGLITTTIQSGDTTIKEANNIVTKTFTMQSDGGKIVITTNELLKTATVKYTLYTDMQYQELFDFSGTLCASLFINAEDWEELAKQFDLSSEMDSSIEWKIIKEYKFTEVTTIGTVNGSPYQKVYTEEDFR